MKGFHRLPMGEGEAMPAHRPYFPALPSYYRDVEFQLVYFHTDPAIVREHLPEPLEPDPEGLAVAFSIKVPFCTSYGPFNEAGISLKCLFRGESGFFNTHLYLDNPAAICSGRERWGAPKEYANVEVGMAGNLVRCHVVKDGVAVMTLTSDVVAPARPEEVIPIFPGYRLKLIPAADGPYAAIKQIVVASPEDYISHKLFKGTNAGIEFGSSANTDLAALAPRDIVAAFWEVASYTETYGSIVYDYLDTK